MNDYRTAGDIMIAVRWAADRRLDRRDFPRRELGCYINPAHRPSPRSFYYLF